MNSLLLVALFVSTCCQALVHRESDAAMSPQSETLGPYTDSEFSENSTTQPISEESTEESSYVAALPFFTLYPRTDNKSSNDFAFQPFSEEVQTTDETMWEFVPRACGCPCPICPTPCPPCPPTQPTTCAVCPPTCATCRPTCPPTCPPTCTTCPCRYGKPVLNVICSDALAQGLPIPPYCSLDKLCPGQQGCFSGCCGLGQ